MRREAEGAIIVSCRGWSMDVRRLHQAGYGHKRYAEEGKGNPHGVSSI